MFAKHFWRNHDQMTIVEHWCHVIVTMDGIHHRRMTTMVIIACEFFLTKRNFMKLIIPVLLSMVVIWFLFTQDRFNPLFGSICVKTHYTIRIFTQYKYTGNKLFCQRNKHQLSYKDFATMYLRIWKNTTRDIHKSTVFCTWKGFIIQWSILK